MQGAWVVARMKTLLVSVPDGMSPELDAAVSTVEELATAWTSVGTREVVREAVDARDPVKRQNPGESPPTAPAHQSAASVHLLSWSLNLCGGLVL